MRKYLCLAFILFILFCGFTFKVDNTVVNYYNTVSSLTFNELSYNLSWSSHPNAAYYKQEYIPNDNTIDQFKDMLLVDFIITDMPVENAIQAQISQINLRKKTDDVCNYSVLKNKEKKEYLLDFIMSQNKNNQINLVEWDAYRYQLYTDSAGHKGILLFGVSHRAYNDDVPNFMRYLKQYRDENLKTFSAYPIPQIQIK